METLNWVPVGERLDLLTEPVARAVPGLPDMEVAEIDADLADTAAFCEMYGVSLDESANCVVVAAKRGGEVRYAACMVLATMRVDVNGVVRRHLDARRASFAPMAEAVELTGMEYGGITPIGLPDGWPILVDAAVAAHPRVVVGSGVRRSKLALSGAALTGLKGAEVIDLAN
ncbi:YbaK/EbsC family protein [Nonomuraea sp. NPDC050556]|uniref:YbaK/EbsC family protein n=1 Tax=Nonomuraea sp. NPDC050556 TaxID=3364369 RepID=UPI00379A5A88